jgi:hypothetical protein
MSVFSDAAIYLEQHGWCQGKYYNRPVGAPFVNGDFKLSAIMGKPSACLSGALALVCPDYKTWSDALELIGCQLGGRSVSVWNDRPERTVEDVLLVLKQADCPAEERRRTMDLPDTSLDNHPSS